MGERNYERYYKLCVIELVYRHKKQMQDNMLHPPFERLRSIPCGW